MSLEQSLITKINKFKRNVIKLIPVGSVTTPSSDTTNGSVGNSGTYARSDHTHPKSTLYAESNHSHSNYLTSHQDISGKFDTAGTGLTSSGTTVSADIGNSSNTSSSKLVACNDSRLSDARTPTSHNQNLSTITDTTTVVVTVTYTDSTPSETIYLVKYTGSS